MAVGVFSDGILKIPHLSEFLGAPVVRHSWPRFQQPVEAVAGWGLRPTSLRARRYAERHALPYIAVEDGFLRSVGLSSNDPPLSLVVDDLGIYYDGTRPSRLELLISRDHSAEESSRARNLRSAWRAARVSKYNHLREYAGELPERYVLVVDQTFGDASIEYGMAERETFQRMLEAAVCENTQCTVLVKIHPDVFSGRKKGHFDADVLARMARVHVLREDVHPVDLIERSEAIYTVTSQVGFEGLLWSKPVRAFGMPFYAGWGLTDDALPAPDRRKSVSLDSLLYAALVDYPRYVDPETGRRCEVERIIEWMNLQRRMRARFPRIMYGAAFQRFKRHLVRDFFQGSTVHFVRDAKQVPEDATLVLWGQGHREEKRPVVRVEDGFLRSVGLGADLVRPLSWVMDRQGMYYDATAPSDLEQILQTTQFSNDLRRRAEHLRYRLIEHGLTKYNVGTGAWHRPPEARRVILVPGQVEADASLRYGAPEVKSNMGLLRAVREANPSAYIIYKPHPDVLAALRTKGRDEDDAIRWCDEVVTDVSMGQLLPAVDEVHVLTSLTGFEALLRGKRVVCYGQPFYAGWGLTDDRVPIARRTRPLSLDELVAGTLLLYPTYVSRTTGKFTTAERALDELLEWRRQQANPSLVKRLRRAGLRIGKRLRGGV